MESNGGEATVKMMAINGEEGGRFAEGCERRSGCFLKPVRSGVEEDATVDVAAVTVQGSFAVATAPVWGIGQRVKIPEKGEGIVLFVGELPFAAKALRGNAIWYGVALDDKNGRHDGFFAGKKYFSAAKNMVHLFNLRGCRP